MFHIEQIELRRIEELLEIIREKTRWLDVNHKKMWDIAKMTKDGILKLYDDPLLFLAFENQTVIGGFILLERDKNAWVENMEDQAYYIHKIVVKTEFGGQGYAEKMIDWAKEHGKANGKQFLRLEYDINRNYLDQLYTANGFVKIGQCEVRPGLILMKGECKLS